MSMGLTCSSLTPGIPSSSVSGWDFPLLCDFLWPLPTQTTLIQRRRQDLDAPEHPPYLLPISGVKAITSGGNLGWFGLQTVMWDGHRLG